MNFSRTLLVAVGLPMCLCSSADTVTFEEVGYAGPIAVADFVALGDTAGLASTVKPLALTLDTRSLDYKPVNINSLPAKSDVKGLNVIKADFENRKFTSAEIGIDGLGEYVAYIDGKEYNGGKVKLHPSTHTLLVKYVSDGDSDLSPRISVSSDTDGAICAVNDGKRMFVLEDVLYGKRINGAHISPDGGFIIVDYTDITDGGSSNFYQRLYDVKRQRFVATLKEYARWMNKSDRYFVERHDYDSGRHLVAVDPVTDQEEIIAVNIPEGSYTLSPTDDYLLFTMVREGEKEDPEIYQVLNPEDRQPGWRDRVYPAIYRFSDGLLQPLAMSKDNVAPIDISDDGSKLLLQSQSLRLTKRPTTLFNIISLDLSTMHADTIIADDGFIAGAAFSPDARQLVVMGGPEVLDRVGCVLPPDVTPSIYDNQLFLMDIDTKHVTPLTRDFDPSINSFYWGRHDNRIYITATERDMYTLYSIDPKTGDISPVKLPENVIKGIDMAVKAPVCVAWGQSDSNPDAVYLYNTKSGKTEVVDRPSQQRLADVKLGQCQDWVFENSRGDRVYGRYYLPDNFDPDKKYPLIVNYYGGCTPSTRLFESRYPLHVYSSLGYVVLQLQPSGATGFGQEWSSRHVSTAGKGVAEDIIEGTKQFCEEMNFVDPQKIGCIGASYGGFMTQYLLTQTDLFASAISHAGISDHTSYWGEGYWGYSYSEVSMGEDLPWTNPDLYVKQSPLYNADKIHTPLLLLHGDVDHNVPVGESIQMFTALKRLGQDVALVQVSDQDHHITADSKRKKWQDTIFAWFAKYLQDDNTWWLELYPEKNL